MSKSNPSINRPQPRQIALIGNPNCGKSTLFNRLTGSNQRIGNWPGVTVEQKHGYYLDSDTNTKLEVVDLPGCYSLVTCEDIAIDEKVTCEFVLNSSNTLYLNVIDASHLSRDLYLTLQLLELGVPVIVALNCIDLAQDAGLKINLELLSKALGCAVVPIMAKTGHNLAALKAEIRLSNTKTVEQLNNYQFNLPESLQPAVDLWRDQLNPGQALHALEGDSLLLAKLKSAAIDYPSTSLDLPIAQHRHNLVQEILHNCVHKQLTKQRITAVIDHFVLHKVLGPVIFALVMYAMFTTAINLGGMLQLIFDQRSEQIFVNDFYRLLLTANAPDWLLNILVFGVGKALNITITFVPVLAAMFLCLGILEGTGYMTRAAFMVDRLMRVIGLPGKAFVPLIVGFGCNVPAVMGARTLASKRERILTIMMTPFMSCSARLAIYAIFVAAFFPIGGQNVIFSLYLIGILVAVLTGFALRTTILPNERSLSMVEMPDYRWPTLISLARQVWHRVKSFLVKAGSLIIILCVLINGLGNSALETIGKKITPAFAPIGIKQDNWPATVGLLTGLIAKEAVIGTLNSAYSLTANLNIENYPADNSLSQNAQNEMLQRFGGTIPAYAYLLFTLLYFPCVSVVAVIARELSFKWAAFSVLWSTGLAYIIAALFYQTATWSSINSAATIWIGGLSLTLGLLFIAVRKVVGYQSQKVLAYKPVPTPLSITQ